MTQTSSSTSVWVPEACTLPTQEQPLRIAEFDALFADDVTAVQRLSPDVAQFELHPDAAVAARAANLAVRETGCCSFFEFRVVASGGHVTMQVRTSPDHIDVLDAVVERARSAAGRAG